MSLPEPKAERKVEYVELIYDLIFVYVISRNGALLHTIENGFVTPGAFLTYLASTFIVLQIWYLSTLYINQYGDGSLREHLMLFINMYLLYHMADGIRADWGPVYFRYNGAWALILLNLAVNFHLTGRKRVAADVCHAHCGRHALMLLIEAGVVLLSMPVYVLTGYALAPWALVFGLAALFLTRDVDNRQVMDFPHLAERVMLYIVFTFGEMILGITGYFDDGVSPAALYYSLMAFAVVVGLFSGYGHYYNHLMDPEAETHGGGYMLLHIVMVLALNNITAGLEYMQEDEVLLLPKTIFLTASILVYYLCLLATQRYARTQVAAKRRAYRFFLVSFLLYGAAALLLRRWPWASVALTAGFIYAQLWILHFGSKQETQNGIDNGGGTE